MSFYSWWQKIGYRLKAKSRHGVHSPFVYDFIEQVLLKDPPKAITGLMQAYPALNQKQHSLLEAIVNRYRPAELLWDKGHFAPDGAGAGILYLIAAGDPLPGFCSENDIVAILDIHADAGHTKAWLEQAGSQSVLLSLDIFEMGILFFKKDFKVKQHFILKYR